MIELRGRLIRLGGPALAAIVRNRGAAVIGVDHPVRMRGIDPQSVIIAVRCANEAEGVPAVGRLIHRSIQHIDRIDALGISENVREIPGALREAMIGIDEMPVFAGILAAIDAAFFGFDDGIDAIAVGAGNGDTDAAKNARRAARDLRDVSRSRRRRWIYRARCLARRIMAVQG